MDSETRRFYDRMRLYFLMQAHPHWHPDSLAEVIGRTGRWVRDWQQRFAEDQSGTLGMFCSRSRAPHTRPEQTSQEVKHLIGRLREQLSEKYHRNAGARLILHELKQHTYLEENGHFVPRSPSTVNNILREMGYIQSWQRQPREPVVLPEPNEEWEMDFGEIRIDFETKLEFFLVIDRGTSRVVYLEGSMGYTAETALEAVARLLLTCGLPQRLRFDRDPRFVGSWTMDSYPAALVRFLRVIGVEPVVCPSHRPDLKPFVERGVGTLKAEWLARFSLNEYADAIEVLPGFLFYHNADRVHFGRACNGQTPDEAFPTLPPLPRVPETVNPDAWLWAVDGRVFQRRITSNGTIQIDKHTYSVSYDRAKTNVLVYLDAENKQFHVLQDNTLLRSLDIKGLHGKGPMDFQDYVAQMKAEARSIEMHRWLTWFRPGEIPL